MPIKGNAEGACRSIADALGDVGYCNIFAEIFFRERHAPSGCILHRRDAYFLAETIEKGRTRHGSFLG